MWSLFFRLFLLASKRESSEKGKGGGTKRMMIARRSISLLKVVIGHTHSEDKDCAG